MSVKALDIPLVEEQIYLLKLRAGVKSVVIKLTLYIGFQIFKIFFYIGVKNFIPVLYRYILSENNKIIVS